ncbi:heterokaryon incompatibility protein-domain-containing protein [Microdochium trichocladiopsis]|uniref:Heterokaryon incompatibility protein-domain-containing protein n=1 Tax=Microdochium trichocladiopsis TaxID=1682393 RepID=A0A9P8YGW0_9PEZI|nr:heterokaryon incompatibility protein-domain-containing protein [Microdochium trichocladiopsis]KAH7041477.1 heterokaryon incompatibility protein-domain-containing protein [Microdochium trichocladiopsis]
MPPLRFAMKTISLDESPDFTALSYVWGDPTDTMPIIVNDIEVAITRNLYSAVVAMSRYQTRPPFWADAVCINQRDNDERSSQVKLMGRIYRNALRVCCHLGEPTPNFEAYVRYHYRIDHRLDDPWAQVLHDWDQQGKSAEWQAGQITAILVGQVELRKLPYFERMWTFQESLLPAERALFFLGDIHFRYFNTRRWVWKDPPPFVTSAWKQHEKNPESRESSMQPWMEILHREVACTTANEIQFDHLLQLMILGCEQLGILTLSSLLYMTRLRRCGDLRDKIFGVLAILPTVEWECNKLGEILDAMRRRFNPNSIPAVEQAVSDLSRPFFDTAGARQAARDRYLAIDYRKSVEEVARDALYYIATVENGKGLGPICLSYMPYRSALSGKLKERGNNGFKGQMQHRGRDGSQLEALEDKGQPTGVLYPSWLPDITSRRLRASFASGGSFPWPKWSQSVEWLPRKDSQGDSDRLRFRVRPLGRVLRTIIFPTMVERIHDMVAALLKEAWPKMDPSLDEIDQELLSMLDGAPTGLLRPNLPEELQGRIRELVSLIKSPPPPGTEPEEPDTSLYQRLRLLLLMKREDNYERMHNRDVPVWLLITRTIRWLVRSPPEADSLQWRRQRQSIMHARDRLAGRVLFVLDSGIVGLCSDATRIGDVAAHSDDFGNTLMLRPDCRRHHQAEGVTCDGSPGAAHECSDTDDMARQTHLLVDYACIDGLISEQNGGMETVQEIKDMETHTIVLG